MRYAILDGEAHVWVVRLYADQHIVEKANSLLSEDERQRAVRFHFDSLRTSFVLSHAVLRRLLGCYCGYAPADVDLVYGSHGKPFLADTATNVCFNMSHSGVVAAYAFIRGHEIGVDVEQHRPLTDMEYVARRFFSSAEFGDIMSQVEAERHAAFFKRWVCKEAYIKARGGGLSIPLDRFEVSFSSKEPEGLVHLSNHGSAGSAWKIQQFLPAFGYSGAVAFEDPSCTVRVFDIRPAAALLLDC